MKGEPMRELKFAVADREMAALASGEPGQTAVLALHGWLDNAESFRPLARQLHDCNLVALDMAGHGLSDRRCADGEYNIWNDLPDILEVVDQLGWRRFELIGHSRGAIVAALFAAARPERVKHLVLLDAWSPRPVELADTAALLGRYLSDRGRLRRKPPRVFDSVEQAVASRTDEMPGPTSVERIVRRNLKPLNGGWCRRTDARLMGASAFKLTAGHNAAIMSSLTMPVLLILAERGLAARLPEGYEIPLAYETMAGGHHFHMEESVTELAVRLREFFATSGRADP